MTEKQKYIKPYAVSINPNLPDYVQKDDLENRMTQTQLGTIEDKYLIQDNDKNRIETVNDLFYRVARSVAEADKIYSVDEGEIEELTKEFYELMSGNYFLPNSPTLMNAGRELGQLSACFVLPIEDDMDSIFQTIKDAAMIHKSGGGTGFSFSRLRAKKDIVSKTRRYAGGPISFLGAYDACTETVKQAGTRRGANMGELRVDHPDIYDWIFAKAREGDFENFNLSIAATDEFMKAVLSNDVYYLIDPRTKTRRKSDTVRTKKQFEQELEKIKRMNHRTEKERKEMLSLPSLYLEEDSGSIICRYNGDKVGLIKNDEVALYAKKVFDDIVNLAWKNGEPGVIFIDTINKSNPTPLLGEIESTNPCGEQPLLPYESCNLGSINLSKFVKDNEINYKNLEYVVEKATHFLDNVIDVNKYPLPQIEKITKDIRKIGLGVMGFSDMLIELGIPYDSEKALRVAEDVMKFIDDKAFENSVKLAEKRGEFPCFKNSIYNKEGAPKIRNATRTTIAPTGTLSLAGGCSSGIEPLFDPKFRHIDGTGEVRYIINPYLSKKLEKEGIDSKQVLKALDEGISLQDMPLPRHIKEIFKTSNDLEGKVHLNIQNAFQKHVNNAVSKTINFPYTTSKESIYDAYFDAWRMGLKGLTVYRSGSREREVITRMGSSKEKKLKDVKKLRVAILREEPIGRDEKTGKIKKLYGFKTLVGGVELELFLDTNYATKEETELLRYIAIDTSMDMRRGKSIKDIKEDILDKIASRGEGVVPSGLGYFNGGIIDALEAILTNRGLVINWKRLKELSIEMEDLINTYDIDVKKNDSSNENRKKEYESSGKICPKCREEIHISGGCEVCGCGSICG